MHKIALVIALVIGILFLMWLICMFIVAYILFAMHLKKRKPETWARVDFGETPLQDEMYKKGKVWSQEFSSHMKEVQIENDGLKLFGEFYDFGYDKVALIIPGRSDSLTYSYYFAKPYAESGFNVLVVDMRAHGWSEGKYNSIGHQEYKDILKWIAFIHDEYHMEKVVIHALCMGAQAVMRAITHENCPKYVEAFIVEGMYTTFYETFKSHALYLGYPCFPAVQLMDVWTRLFLGQTIFYGPINEIEKMRIPFLMLHGKKDVFSLPEKAEILYEKCGSAIKKLVWFEEGDHSQLRISNEESYDEAICSFLRSVSTKG